MTQPSRSRTSFKAARIIRAFVDDGLNVSPDAVEELLKIPDCELDHTITEICKRVTHPVVTLKDVRSVVRSKKRERKRKRKRGREITGRTALEKEFVEGLARFKREIDSLRRDVRVLQNEV